MPVRLHDPDLILDPTDEDLDLAVPTGTSPLISHNFFRLRLGPRLGVSPGVWFTTAYPELLGLHARGLLG